MTKCCGDRQRKCNGLGKWLLHLFIENLPVNLYIVLLFLACGLYRYMASANATVAWALFALTGLGILFYVGIALADASSYDCLFQPPAYSVLLRRLWNRIESTLMISIAFPTIVTVSTLRNIVEVHTFHIQRPLMPQ